MESPPSSTELIALMAVGSLAGIVNALRRFSAKGAAQSLLIGAAEGMTALFITIITYMILRSMEPALLGWKLDSFGMIGISGAVAHIGLRQSIRYVLRFAQEKDQS